MPHFNNVIFYFQDSVPCLTVQSDGSLQVCNIVDNNILDLCVHTDVDNDNLQNKKRKLNTAESNIYDDMQCDNFEFIDNIELKDQIEIINEEPIKKDMFKQALKYYPDNTNNTLPKPHCSKSNVEQIVKTANTSSSQFTVWYYICLDVKAMSTYAGDI